jgi:hypothetical protein
MIEIWQESEAQAHEVLRNGLTRFLLAVLAPCASLHLTHRSLREPVYPRDLGNALGHIRYEGFAIAMAENLGHVTAGV